MHPTDTERSDSFFCKSIVKATESLLSHECHSKSDWRKLPRIPFTKIFPACVFPKTGLAVALFQTKGNVNVFPSADLLYKSYTL